MKSLLGTHFFLAVLFEKYERKCIWEIRNNLTILENIIYREDSNNWLLSFPQRNSLQHMIIYKLSVNQQLSIISYKRRPLSHQNNSVTRSNASSK